MSCITPLHGDIRSGICHEDFERVIKIILYVHNDTGSVTERLRYAKVKFDTGNPVNLISEEFLLKFNRVLFEQRTARHILSHPGGGRTISIGTVQGRWTADEPWQWDGWNFGTRLYDAEFEVCQGPQEFEIIFGSEMLSKYKLVSLDVPFGYPGWRTPLPAVDSKLINS